MIVKDTMKMSTTISINPHYHPSIQSALVEVSKPEYQDKDIILRISEATDPAISLQELAIRQNAFRRDFEDETGSEPVVYASENSLQLTQGAQLFQPGLQSACVDLIRSASDMDISLPMGFITFENPLCNLETEKCESDCLLTVRDLHNYLATLGAVPYRDENVAFTGAEIPVPGSHPSCIQSSLIFTTTYRFLLLDQANAVGYMRSLLQVKEEIFADLVKRGEKSPDTFKPVIKSTTEQIKSKLYVVSLPNCLIPIVKENPLYTQPVSKQRLLYIFDCIQDWVKSFRSKWIDLTFNTMAVNPKEKAIVFRYRIEKMVQGWTQMPEEKINPVNALKRIRLEDSLQWHTFSETDLPLEKRLQCVIEFLFEYGIDMPLESYAGSETDYKPDDRFTPLVRNTSSPTILAQPVHQDPTHNTRGRGRGNTTDSFRGRGRGVAIEQPTTQTEQITRQYGERGNRGRGRGRSTNLTEQQTGANSATSETPVSYGLRGRGRGRGSQPETQNYNCGRGRANSTDFSGQRGRANSTQALTAPLPQTIQTLEREVQEIRNQISQLINSGQTTTRGRGNMRGRGRGRGL